MRNKITSIFTLAICCYSAAQAATLSKQELLNRVVERATESERLSANYGFDADMVIRWLSGDGKTTKVEKRDYQTVWNDRYPHLQLVQLNDKQLTSSQKAEEE